MYNSSSLPCPGDRNRLADLVPMTADLVRVATLTMWVQGDYPIELKSA